MFEKSKQKLLNGTHGFDSARTSSTAFLPWSNHAASCVRERVSEFQGHEPVNQIEPLQITAYEKGQHYHLHYDWFGASHSRMWDRAATIFGILDADCDNCTTDFPYLLMDWSNEDERWCEFVDCTASHLKVLPVPGSALFWRNLDAGGRGDERTVHAGARLFRGYKVGLNIWTRQNVNHSDNA